MQAQLIRKNWLKYSIFSTFLLTGLLYGRKSKDKHIRMGIAGLLGQITTDLIFHPLDVVNTRTKFLFEQKLNIRQMARRIYNISGLFGIFRGGSVMLWGASFSGFVYFSTYRRFKEYFFKKFGGKQNYNTFVYLLSSILTQSIVYPLAYPVDLIKTRLQTGEYNYLNFQEGLKDVYNKSVHKGLAKLKDYYVGFTPNFALNLSGCVLVFLTFESTRDFIARRKRIRSEDVKGFDYFLCTLTAGIFSSLILNFLEVYSIQKMIHGDKITFKKFLSRENLYALKSGISAKLISGVFYTITLLETVNIYGNIFKTHL